jgi:hypothetical protein
MVQDQYGDPCTNNAYCYCSVLEDMFVLNSVLTFSFGGVGKTGMRP